MLFPNQTAFRPQPRIGAVAPLVALCLVILLGIVAIALDGGVLLDQRRQAQAAADAAALAAAVDLYQNYPTNGGVDRGGTAVKSALTTAAAMGYDNDDGNNTIVTVNVPQETGPFAAQAGYAEVVVQWNQLRSFSNIFGSGTILVKARAVAAGRWVPFNDGVIVLHPTAEGALKAKGDGDMEVLNSSVIVDSNSSQAATTAGGAQVADPANPIAITGTGPGYSGSLLGKVVTGQQPMPDPLAYLPAPDPTRMPIQAAHAGRIVDLAPGRYLGGLFFSGQTSVNMAPGIYYLDEGGFCFSGRGNLNAVGVMIYSTGGLSITGQGNVILSPPTSGIYQGISYFQGRDCTATARIAGGGGMNITGTLYVPGGLVQLQGDGDTSIASQVISLFMTSGGDGVTNIVWGPPSARMRAIQLVE